MVPSAFRVTGRAVSNCLQVRLDLPVPQSTRRLENEIVPFGTVASCRQGQGSRTMESSESSDSAERSHAFRLQAAHSPRPTSFRAPHFEIRRVSSLCMCIPVFGLTTQESVRRSARAVARLPSRSASRSSSQSSSQMFSMASPATRIMRSASRL